MTLDQLDLKFREAGWLIARRSAAVAGKALIFSVGSLDDAAEEMAGIYSLSAEERARVQPTHAHHALESVQTAANSLFGDALGMSTEEAASSARKAVTAGRKLEFIKMLVLAGPKAAKMMVGGGKAVGTAAGRSTPWGWIATAAYAVGTASWFAYNLHAFNIAVYELVRLREGIELPPSRLDEQGMLPVQTFEPILSSLSTAAGAIGGQASVAWDGTIEAGGQLAGATSGFFGRLSAKLKRNSGMVRNVDGRDGPTRSAPSSTNSGGMQS